MALSKKNRVKKRKDFSIIFKTGRKLKGSFLFLKSVKNKSNSFKTGFVIPASIYKKSVERNKIKRILSEVVFKEQKKLKTGQEIIIVVTSKGILENKKEASEELKKILKTLE